MSIRIEPAELRFPFALNAATVQKLRVVAVGASTTFKIKTTNPKRYSVRPNLGVAWMGAAAEVTVQLCAFSDLPPDLAKCKDKFQVLSLVLSDEQSQQLEALGPEERRGMLNELWAADEAQAAAVITKVRCSFALPSTQPLPIPEEGEVMASPTPATPAAAWAAGTTPDAADAPTPDAGPASGAEPSPQPSAPAAAEASAATEQLRTALAESEAARRTLKRQMEKAMLEHEDEVEALKQEVNEQRLKRPPPPLLPPVGQSKGGASGAGGFTTVQLLLVAMLGLLLGAIGQMPFGASQPAARVELRPGTAAAAASAAAAAAPKFESELEPFTE